MEKTIKILITGNQGYVGSIVSQHLRKRLPHAILIGADTGFFANILTGGEKHPERHIDFQWDIDIRNIQAEQLEGIDAIVHLAAISNDPMGNFLTQQTEDINGTASAGLAIAAKKVGVRNFIFASSCSLYGFSEEARAKTEDDTLQPLTAYAKSKEQFENVLGDLADDRFMTTALRFSTACGYSPRLRLDLVLNDFVASAITTGTIEILSDGSPWRPLIHVKDMALAIEWALIRSDNGTILNTPHIAVNVGRTEWNYQVSDLAEAVAARIPGTTIKTNSEASPDKRSYRVDFQKYASLAPDHLPQVDLQASIHDLYSGLVSMNFDNILFRRSNLIRLNALKNLIDEGQIDQNLYWLK